MIESPKKKEIRENRTRNMKWSSVALVLVVFLVVNLMVMGNESSSSSTKNVYKINRDGINYAEALTKSILFFEGQRSGPLPSSQRMKWRKDSALKDGHDVGVDLVGGYYDAGDNLKFNFPMAFSSTMIAWGVLEFGKFMGPDLKYAREAIKWGTDYFLKSTRTPGVVYVQVGDPYSDHNCWQRPEDMDTNRTAYAVDKDHPGSEVSAEIAAALASASIVFKGSHPRYSKRLLNRAIEVFAFADKYQGNYNDSLGEWVCPFYCDWSGYKDELLWGAAWLYKASKKTKYLSYVIENMHQLEADDDKKKRSTVGEFGWDNKHAGINVLIANMLLAGNRRMPTMSRPYTDFIPNADKFVCTVLPESPTRIANYSKGGLLFKSGGSNMQNPSALSFLLVVYARYLNIAKKLVRCEDNIVATSDRLITIAKHQVDYILGKNPSNMSYMVGFGHNFPKRIHHRGSSLPSIDDHPEHIKCKDGTPYYESENPNPNYLIGAVVGGPAINDSYTDSRSLFVESEPTTYINAPLVGLFAYFDKNSS